MMAVIMGVAAGRRGDARRAADLGIAFQLANIARDIVEDDAVGRIYLPATWLAEEDLAPGALGEPRHRAELAEFARRLAALAAPYEASARVGADRLPRRSRWAVLSRGEHLWRHFAQGDRARRARLGQPHDDQQMGQAGPCRAGATLSGPPARARPAAPAAPAPQPGQPPAAPRGSRS